MVEPGESACQAKRAARLALRAAPASVVERYRHCRHRYWCPLECACRFLGDVSGKRILEFGCGEGENSVVMAALGAHVTAIGISPEMIAVARERARLDGVEVDCQIRDIFGRTGS
jgi:2-polyprenyl-3-methyl-5-hydroxy-6-metoxy-1,4-benzoquinol methylase